MRKSLIVIIVVSAVVSSLITLGWIETTSIIVVNPIITENRP